VTRRSDDFGIQPRASLSSRLEILTIRAVTGPDDTHETFSVTPRVDRHTALDHRRHERRRRQRRRLLPSAALVLIGLILLGWFALGSPSTHTSPTSTTTMPTATTTTLPPYTPAAIKTPVSPAQSGEGQWVAQDPWVPGPPAVMTTTWRPQPSQPAITAYASWIRTSSTQLALYPGYKGPGETTLNRGPEMVPTSSRSTLMATFNSGFYEADTAAGFYTNGTVYFPMRNGVATVVSYTDGSVDIINWQSGTTPPPNVVMARQNLAMLVDNGAPTAATQDGTNWGITLGGVPAVWRTGLGIDAKGNLIYVAASQQTAATLAQILIQAGAIRGMQLDINPAWPIFVTYGAPGAGNPTLDVPNPQQTSNRFLFSSTKDFFAVFTRVPGVVQQPW